MILTVANRFFTTPKTTLSLFGAASLMALSAHSYAQEQPHSAQVKKRANAIEEVIVSARKRDETLIDIPLSVSSIGGDKFEAYDIDDMSDIAERVPGFYVNTSTIGVQLSMRGLGDMVIGASFSNSIGLSIDGIYYARMRWFEVGTFDVQQINALRGPQGVYFGKNVTAGLVDIKSKAPGAEWTANGALGYESEIGKKLYEIGAGGPVTDWLGVRLAVQRRDDDGFMDNVRAQTKEQRLEQDLGRLSIDIAPTEDLEIELRFQEVRSDRFGQTSQIANCGDDYRLVLAVNNSLDDCMLNNTRTAGKSLDGGYVVFDEEYTLNDSSSQAMSVNWNVGGFDIHYSLGHWIQDVELTLDPDFSDLQVLDIEFPETYEQLSHELRITPPAFGPFELLLGVYVDQGDLDTEQNDDFDVAAYGGINGLVGAGSAYKRLVEDIDSQAIFSELRYDITDTIRLMIGGRYTKESRDAEIVQELGSLGNPFDNNIVSTLAFNNVFQWTEIHHKDKRNSDNFSPSIVAQWDFSAQGRIYASYKEAFKSGGFDSQVDRQEGDGTVNEFEYDDELVESYEVGLKSTLFENTMSTSIALFHSQYTNLQVQAFDGFVGTDTLNAAATTNKGVEAEVMWKVSPSLTLSVSGAYVDATYDEFSVAPCYAGQTAAQGCSSDGKQDLAGATLPLAPKTSGNLSIDWEQPFFDKINLAAGININYRDEVFLNLAHDPHAHSDSLTQANFYVSIADIQRRYVFSVTGKNITDEDYANGFIEQPLFTGSYIQFRGEPRTIMSKFSFNF